MWRIINEDGGGLLAWPGRGLARALSWGYGLGAGLNQLSYDLGWRRSKRGPLPVIGVGNLAAGGTGKTPLTMEVVNALLSLGHKPVVISRGYGRQLKGEVIWVSRGAGPLLPARQCGDEPYLLARRLPVPVLVGADRLKLAQAAAAELGRVVLVGDDLFQHRRLYRNLDILALDAARPLGNGFLLPRGPLREPRSALRRAGLVVLTRAENPEAARASRVWLRSFWGAGPVLECAHVLSGFYDLAGKPLDDTSGPVLAFCGLARPESFHEALLRAGLQVADSLNFADHHWYSPGDLAGLQAYAAQIGVRALVCTEKDAVRLEGIWDSDLPLWVARLRLDFKGNNIADVLRQCLERANNA